MRLRLLVLLLASSLTACGGAHPEIARPGSGPAHFTVLRPCADGVSNARTPEVAWEPVAGATAYRASLWRDAQGIDLLESRWVVATCAARFQARFEEGAVLFASVAAYDADGGLLATTAAQRFMIQTTPDWMPAAEVSEVAPHQGQFEYVLHNLMDFPPEGEPIVPAVVVRDRAGAVRWWFRPPEDGRVLVAHHTPRGTLYWIQQTGSRAAGTARFTGYETRWDGTEIWRSRPGALLHHDLLDGPGGQPTYMTYVARTFDGVAYEGDGIEIADRATGAVLWSWNIFDHFDPRTTPTPEADRPGLSGLGGDWSHANSATWDPARSLFWVSVRHFDALLAVDYPSGAVRAVLGRGGLGGDDLMRHQHAPEVQPDGSLVLFDNGNGRMPAPYSSLLHLDVDLDAGLVTPRFRWRDMPDVYARALGDADRLPGGNYLGTAGTLPRIFEVDPAGNLVWDLKLASGRFWVYRCEPISAALLPASAFPFRSVRFARKPTGAADVQAPDGLSGDRMGSRGAR